MPCGFITSGARSAASARAQAPVAERGQALRVHDVHLARAHALGHRLAQPLREARVAQRAVEHAAVAPVRPP